MRLTVMSDYAIRLLMYVAQHPERLCTISEVARAYEISEAHLMKITHQLALAGWLETVRGKGGGMRLATRPEQVNLGAVVRSIEPDFAIVECLSGSSACQLSNACQLTGIMSGALQSFMSYLNRYTLADLLAQGTASTTTQTVSFHHRPAGAPADALPSHNPNTLSWPNHHEPKIA
ncbi:Rrf2 family transcriptional regulator [Rhodoferax sp.]|uniref:RrF2 family transcriptional regulator n=1 Tax=Rhodoferax sp. TaxID=50421 RepID=UPI0025D5BDF5|nr:Rrf2 family transcriptional regulator [Rhodoferax sp.]MCM2340422.1 Rrf2 family transcriptional regulator [Rhodoferax sp.]